MRDTSVKLNEKIVGAKSKVSYSKAIEGLVVWLNKIGVLLLGLVRDPDLLDDEVQECLQHLWQTNAPKSWSNTLLAALTDKWPRLRGTLGGSWRICRTWKHLEPAVHRKPWPIQLLLSLLVIASESQEWAISFGLGCGSICALRASEWCKAFFEGVHLPISGTWFVHVGIFAMREPKTARRGAKTRYVLIHHGWFLDRLRWYKSTRFAKTNSFCSYQRCRAWLRKTLVRLRLKANDYRLGGVRGGTISFRYLLGETPDRLQRMGRCACQRTLESYLQPAVSLLSTDHRGPEANRMIESYVTHELVGPFLAGYKRYGPLTSTRDFLDEIRDGGLSPAD